MAGPWAALAPTPAPRQGRRMREMPGLADLSWEFPPVLTSRTKQAPRVPCDSMYGWYIRDLIHRSSACWGFYKAFKRRGIKWKDTMPQGLRRAARALISVSDKTGLAGFARGLSAF